MPISANQCTFLGYDKAHLKYDEKSQSYEKSSYNSIYNWSEIKNLYFKNDELRLVESSVNLYLSRARNYFSLLSRIITVKY